jgi:hypothetical protein
MLSFVINFVILFLKENLSSIGNATHSVKASNIAVSKTVKVSSTTDFKRNPGSQQVAFYKNPNDTSTTAEIPTAKTVMQNDPNIEKLIEQHETK